MKQNKYILSIFMLLLATMMQAQVSVESEIDSTHIMIGEQACLRLNVKAKKGARVEFPSFEPQTEMTKGVEVVEILEDTLKDSDDQRIYRRTYTLTAWDGRKYTLPTLQVKVDGKKYTTKSFPLEVEEVAVDTLHLDEMRPAKDILDNDFTWSEWLPLLGLLVLAVLLGAAIVYLYRHLRDEKPILAGFRLKKKLLPHEKALFEIDKITQEKLTQAEDQKAYYTKLTDILRIYLRERFGINAMEMTSSEIIERLQQEENPAMITELSEVFTTADLVKFAKHSTLTNERDMYLSHVVKFIDETKIDNEQEEVPNGNQQTETDQRSRRIRRLILVIISILCALVASILAYIGWQIYLLLI